MLSLSSTLRSISNVSMNYYIRSYSTEKIIQANSAIYERHGNPLEVIKLRKNQLLLSNENNVVLKMLMAPINPADINTIEGVYPIKPQFPAIGGMEGVGKVFEISKNVSELKVGDYVIPIKPQSGTWSDYCVFNERDLIKVNNNIPVLDLSLMSINPCTALRLLEDFVLLERGDWIIQNAANSQVGISIIQIAFSRGIKTINIVRDRETIEERNELVHMLKGSGADIVIFDNDLVSNSNNDELFNNNNNDLVEERVNIFEQVKKYNIKPRLALNCVGGPIVSQMLKLCDDHTTLVTYGAMSKKHININNSQFIFKDLTMKGFFLTNWINNNSFEQRSLMYKEIQRYYLDKILKTTNVDVLPFKEFDLALKISTSQKKKKIVLSLDDI